VVVDMHTISSHLSHPPHPLQRLHHFTLAARAPEDGCVTAGSFQGCVRHVAGYHARRSSHQIQRVNSLLQQKNGSKHPTSLSEHMPFTSAAPLWEASRSSPAL
jgi:hypothetical protein